MKLTTYLHVLQRLKMSGAIPSFSHSLSWRAQGKLHCLLLINSICVQGLPQTCLNLHFLCLSKYYIYQMYAVRSKSFRPDQLFKVTEIKQLCYFSTESPFISTHFSTDTLTSPYMALYILHRIFHLAQLLYVRPETFGPYYVP